MSEARDGGREEPPGIRCLLWRPRPRAVAGRSNPTRGGGWEGQPYIQGVVAVQVQEGLQEPSHVEVQEGRWEKTPLIQGKEQRPVLCGSSP